MKRFAVILLMLIVAAPAFAGEWAQREVKWFKSSIGPLGSSTGMFVRDTSFNVFGGTVSTSGTDALDTTAVFNLDGGAPFPLGSPTVPIAAGTVARDSLIAGYLIFQADSSVAPTGAISSISLILEGSPGKMSWPATSFAGYSPIDSITGLAANGDAAVVVPLPVRGGQKLAGGKSSGSFSFENLRARAVAGVGALPSCRVFLRYWKP